MMQAQGTNMYKLCMTHDHAFASLLISLIARLIPKNKPRAAHAKVGCQPGLQVQ